MNYSVDENGRGVDISVGDIGADREKLLEAFNECREGRCSCPTEEYKKMDSLEIEQNEQDMRLHLKARRGLKIDKAEIEKCLDYTAERVAEDQPGGASGNTRTN